MSARSAIAIALTIAMTACATRSEPVRSPPVNGEVELARIEAQRANVAHPDDVLDAVLWVLGGALGAVTTVVVAVVAHK